MKIGVLTSWPLTTMAGSGVVESIRGFALGLDALGEEIGFVAPVRPARTHTVTFLKRLFYNGGLSRRIKRALLRGELDTLLGFDFDGCYLERRWRPPLTAVCGGTLADILGFESGWHRLLLTVQARLEAQNIAQADAVVVPSRYAADAVIRHYEPARPPVVVPLALDPAAWDATPAVVPHQAPKAPVLLCVARFYRRKGLDLLIRAWATLRPRIGTGTLVLVGSGPEEVRLRSLVRELNLTSSTRFTGSISHRGELKGWYEAADVFVLPSRHETFGLVFLEAAVHGLPVVALDTTAVPEVVHHGETGLLVEAGEDEAVVQRICAALERLLNQPEEARALGRLARERAVIRSWRDAASDLLSALPA